jgi:hypothetical protein
MKRKRKENYWLRPVAGLLLLASGIPALTLFRDRPGIALLIIVAGVTLIVTGVAGIFESWRVQPEDPDERDRKIQRAAYSDSWMVMFWFVIVLLGIDFAGIVELQTTDVLMVMFLGMGISAVYFRWKHESRGDVE